MANTKYSGRSGKWLEKFWIEEKRYLRYISNKLLDEDYSQLYD